jgi:hypothetical protein
MTDMTHHVGETLIISLCHPPAGAPFLVVSGEIQNLYLAIVKLQETFNSIVQAPTKSE